MCDPIAVLGLAVSLFGILIAIVAFYFGGDKKGIDDSGSNRARQGIAVAMGFVFCLIAGASIGALAWRCPSAPVPEVTPTSIMPIPPTATPEGPFDWVGRYVIWTQDGAELVWHFCPGESEAECASWNMYDHNGGIPVRMEITRCKQDGAWIDDSGREHTGLEIGAYDRVSGITVRPCSDSPTACVSTPPPGLVELATSASGYWSKGIWGSSIVNSFTTGVAVIDTDDQDFSMFQIWLDPCYSFTAPGHGYVTGARFWPLDSEGFGRTSAPLVLGEIETVSLPSGTGRWGLGNPR